jgi:hypothetical protein
MAFHSGLIAHLLLASLCRPTICDNVVGHLRGTSSAETGVADHSLHIKNSADHTVVIASSCSQNWTLKANEEISMAVSKSELLWMVPEGTEWDCHVGCSNCFYLNTNITNETVLEASVGYGMGVEVIENGSSVEGIENGTDVPVPSSQNESVSGVELQPDGRFDGAKDSVSCTRLYCDIGRPVLAGTRGLSFEIHGAGIAGDLESAWYGHGHHWHYHRGYGGGYGYRPYHRYYPRHYHRCFWRWGSYSCAWVGY